MSMSDLVVTDPENASALVSAGLKLEGFPLKTNPGIDYTLDDVLLNLQFGNGISIARATMGASALEGFGALIELEEEFKTVYPEGAVLTLTSHKKTGRAIVGMVDPGDGAAFLGLASPNRSGEMFLVFPNEPGHDFKEVVSRISTPRVMVNSAEYLVTIANHSTNSHN
jgi:hypothetical protein